MLADQKSQDPMINPEGALQISYEDSLDSSIDGLPSGRLSTNNEDKQKSKPGKKGKKSLRAEKAADNNKLKAKRQVEAVNKAQNVEDLLSEVERIFARSDQQENLPVVMPHSS